MSGVVFKYTCGRCKIFFITIRRKLGRNHTWISPWTFRKIKPLKECAIRDR